MKIHSACFQFLVHKSNSSCLTETDEILENGNGNGM